MVAFRNSDSSGRTTGLLLRCVLYSLLALGLIIVDKHYDHLGKIRRLLSIAAYPVQVAVESPFEGWNWFRQSVTSRDVLRADNAKLQAELERMTGQKVAIDKRDDPSLLAGVIARIGDRVYDGSLRSRLTELGHALLPN